MGSCTPPKGVGVRTYTRSAPRRKAKRATPATYYECRSRSGHSCGTHHATASAAYRHTVTLNKQVRRTSRKYQGRQDLYDYEKRGAA